MSDRIWFITGASRGFGRSFAQAALAAGDRVAATARDTSSLEELVADHGDAILPIELDVTDHDACFAAVGQAHDRFGRLDVVVNNAGYGLSGAIEELSEEQNNGSQPGNPELAAQALLDTLNRDDPPFCLLLGNVAYDVAVDRYESRLQEFRAGEQTARGADDR